MVNLPYILNVCSLYYMKSSIDKKINIINTEKVQTGNSCDHRVTTLFMFTVLMVNFLVKLNF